MQDAFGHLQSHQRLLPVKIGVALAVLDQALPGGLDDAALAGQREGVALMHEQMQAEALSSRARVLRSSVGLTSRLRAACMKQPQRAVTRKKCTTSREPNSSCQ